MRQMQFFPCPPANYRLSLEDEKALAHFLGMYFGASAEPITTSESLRLKNIHTKMIGRLNRRRKKRRAHGK